MSEIAAAILDKSGPSAALFVDFDGTLVDLAQTPDAIEVPEGLSGLLEDASGALGGALALVSGRPISDLDRHLGQPRIAMSGSHGAEFRLADGRRSDIDPDITAETRAVADRLQHLAALDEHILIEPKTGSVAVHFRLVPEHEEHCREAVAELVETLPGWTVGGGKKIIEARRKGVNKGAAVQALMKAEPFAGRTPIFIGDDVTDEDGMKAATQLGGFGVKVGIGDSVARFRIADVPAARTLLSEIAAKGIPGRYGSEEAGSRNETLID